MEMQLLFYSNFNSYHFDGEKFFEKAEFGKKGVLKEVTRERVEQIAKINNAEQFLPPKEELILTQQIEIFHHVTHAMETWNIPTTVENIKLVYDKVRAWPVQPRSYQDVKHIVDNSMDELEDELII